jgi:very-short-patch-repair endonuclease
MRTELRAAHLPRRALFALCLDDTKTRSARVTEAARGDFARRASATGLEVLMFRRDLVSPHQAQLLEERARIMRFSPTRSEEWLWRRLSGSKTGFAFRRQLVIGPFFVDFACTKVRLAVEVDGPYHEQRERHDARRDRELAKLGFTVLRIQDHLVFSDLDAVVESIIAHASAARR